MAGRKRKLLQGPGGTLLVKLCSSALSRENCAHFEKNKVIMVITLCRKHLKGGLSFFIASKKHCMPEAKWEKSVPG